MNLFDMIFRNILPKEVIFSSIYNYLLQGNETHGMGSLIFDRIIKGLPNEKIVKTLKEYPGCDDVEPEYSLGPEVGRVDSLLKLGHFEKDHSIWFVTEIKIDDASAHNWTKNGPQLERYVKSLYELKGKDFIFIFLIPSAKADASVVEFIKLLRNVEEEVAERCFLMFWKDSDQSIKVPDKNICKISYIEILRQILSEESEGRIDPISTEMRYILKSTCVTIQQDFKRTVDGYEAGRFPDRMRFLSNLPESHRALYGYIEELTGGKRRISTTNTSIGFPYSDHPVGNNYNTLFRVLTMKNCKRRASEIQESDYAKQLIIECDHDVYPDYEFWKNVESYFKDLAEIVMDKYHPNESGKLRTNWIMFNPELSENDIERGKRAIDTLIKDLPVEYEDYLQTQKNLQRYKN